MTDILLDELGDLTFNNGDLVIGRSNEQHQKHILIANKGEYKEFPEVGVGIIDMLNNEAYTETLIETKKQLQYDGMSIKNVSYNEEGKLIIDGNYK